MKCTRCGDVIPDGGLFFRGIDARPYHVKCPPLSSREMAIDEAVRRVVRSDAHAVYWLGGVWEWPTMTAETLNTAWPHLRPAVRAEFRSIEAEGVEG